MAGIEEIKGVIERLLNDRDPFREALTLHEWTPPRSWPPSASADASLLVAIHYLDECADVLRHELHR
jgi:hypothetical protein